MSGRLFRPGGREAHRAARRGHAQSMPPSPRSECRAGPGPDGLLLVVYDLVVRLDHVLRRLGGGRLAGGPAGRLALGALALRALVERGARGGVCPVEVVQGAADAVRLTGAQRLAPGLQRRVEPALRVGGEPVHPLLAVLLDQVDQAVELVALLDLLAPRLVLLRMLLGGLDHAVDFGVAQPARRLDPNLLLLV